MFSLSIMEQKEFCNKSLSLFSFIMLKLESGNYFGYKMCIRSSQLEILTWLGGNRGVMKLITFRRMRVSVLQSCCH